MRAAEPLTVRSGRVRQAGRLAQRSWRHRSRRFVAEGPGAVREALASRTSVVEVFATAAATARHRDLVELAATGGVTWTQVDADVLGAVAGTVTPQGVAAVCSFLDQPLADVVGRGPRLLAVAVHVRDPGNAGTLLRCADAAGADAVVLAGHSVDPYNPKAVRASAGSLFHLPVAIEPDPLAAAASIRTGGLQLLAADPAAGTDLDAAGERGLLTRPTAWLFGNEAHGLGADLLAVADETVSVPCYGRAESLNLAVAAALCLYASARAQRLAGPPAGG